MDFRPARRRKFPSLAQVTSYAKFTVTPPNKLAAGKYPITAYAKRGDEKFSTSLEPLPSLPTQSGASPRNASCTPLI